MHLYVLSISKNWMNGSLHGSDVVYKEIHGISINQSKVFRIVWLKMLETALKSAACHMQVFTHTYNIDALIHEKVERHLHTHKHKMQIHYFAFQIENATWSTFGVFWWTILYIKMILMEFYCQSKLFFFCCYYYSTIKL